MEGSGTPLASHNAEIFTLDSVAIDSDAVYILVRVLTTKKPLRERLVIELGYLDSNQEQKTAPGPVL